MALEIDPEFGKSLRVAGLTEDEFLTLVGA
jgi:hypothetical protein